MKGQSSGAASFVSLEDKMLCVAMVVNHIQILTNNRKQIENYRITCYDICVKIYLFVKAKVKQ